MNDTNKPVGYGHDNKGARAATNYGDGKPAVAHTAPADKAAGKGEAATAKTFFIDGREVDIRDGETIFSAARRLGIELPHLCYSPQPGYRAGRQLPRLHGGDRRRARAGRKLHPHAVAGHEGQDCRPTAPRPRARWSPSCCLTDQPEREVAHDPELAALADRDRHGIGAGPLPKRRHTRRRPIAAIWPWRSISTPASIAISASAPAAKCRSTT